MNARGIPAQSEEANLEKEYSYTVNEMTGERIPFGQEANYGPTQPPAPSGGAQPAAEQSSSSSSSSESGRTRKKAE